MERMEKVPGEKTTKLNIAKNLLEKVAWLLESEIRHFYVSDRTTKHEKIVIEFNHEQKS